MSSDDLLDNLPTHDVEPRAGERIRRRAQAALHHERQLLGRPIARRVSRTYTRAIEPTLVVGACVVYLAWAVQATLALMH